MASTRRATVGWFERLVFAATTKRVIHGLRVGILMPNKAEKPAMFGKLADALELLARHDRRRLARLQRDARGISVELTISGCAEWVRSARLVRLDFEYLKSGETSALHVACALVHEGAHAWIERLGIRYDQERRARIEALCYRSELAFLRRVPDAERLMSEVRSQLERDPQEWTDAAFADRKRARLRQINLPEFLVRFLTRS